MDSFIAALDRQLLGTEPGDYYIVGSHVPCPVSVVSCEGDLVSQENVRTPCQRLRYW